MSSHSTKSIITAMRAAGADPELIIQVMEELEESKDQQRREKTRQRVRRHREKQSDNVSGIEDSPPRFQDDVTNVTQETVTDVTSVTTLSPLSSPLFPPHPLTPPYNPPKPQKPATELRRRFEEAWELWPAIGRKRSKAKDKVFDAYRIAARKAGSPESLNGAITRWIDDPANKADQFAKALERFLRDGLWEHYLLETTAKPDQSPEQILERRLKIWRQNPGTQWPENWGEEPEEVREARAMA